MGLCYAVNSAVLPERWFLPPALDRAPLMLGLVLRHKGVALRITEVEAYMGEQDPGSHAFRGRTKRNAVMYGPPGRAYVYFHMGLHHCVNLVCGPTDFATGVLIRAGEVIDGVDTAMARRNAKGVCRKVDDVARGPARLTVALGIDLSDDGTPVCLEGGPMTLSRPADPVQFSIGSGARVGVSGEGGDAERFPWRFWIAGDPTVSAYRASPPLRARPRS